MMQVVIVGSGHGQLASALLACRPTWASVHLVGRPTLDLARPHDISRILEAHEPEVIINAAAYTDVEGSQADPGTAYAINRDGVAALAQAARQLQARLVHVSTDYVFNGKQGTPYGVNDRPAPLNIYGRSKLTGEWAVERILGVDGWIVRTAWLYAAGKKNFVTKVLDKMRAGEKMQVVCDQVGTPTWACGLAATIWTGVSKRLAGIDHWTDAGVASWYDFAQAIQEEALALGVLHQPVELLAINTDCHLMRTPRPSFSVLDKSLTWARLEETGHHWRAQLRHMLQGSSERHALVFGHRSIARLQVARYGNVVRRFLWRRG
jgi:dTDP-4-dehydrorhamnose reductase